MLFYETLKEVCEKRKTSPSAVCLALKMSKSNITGWKNGRSPKLETVYAIADFLNVSPNRLIQRPRNAERPMSAIKRDEKENAPE